MKTYTVTVANVSYVTVEAEDAEEAMKLVDEKLIIGDTGEIEENSCGWKPTDAEEEDE